MLGQLVHQAHPEHAALVGLGVGDLVVAADDLLAAGGAAVLHVGVGDHVVGALAIVDLLHGDLLGLFVGQSQLFRVVVIEEAEIHRLAEGRQHLVRQIGHVLQVVPERFQGRRPP
ncbi:hypothetical protein D3C72_1524740 [compost metagenome]